MQNPKSKSLQPHTVYALKSQPPTPLQTPPTTSAPSQNPFGDIHTRRNSQFWQICLIATQFIRSFILGLGEIWFSQFSSDPRKKTLLNFPFAWFSASNQKGIVLLELVHVNASMALNYKKEWELFAALRSLLGSYWDFYLIFIFEL